MEPVYWIIAGLIGGIFTGKLMRFHTVHWHGAVDAVIGILSAVIGAMLFRGFGPTNANPSWRVIGVAAASGIVGTFICNDLARTREEEIEEHVVVEHHPEYEQLDRSWEERLLHVSKDPLQGSLDPKTEDGHIRRDQPTYRDGKRLA
jgi:uncharacterized membrane protein YeaQ/YmgE (transglycosylase-associated protein family)